MLYIIRRGGGGSESNCTYYTANSTVNISVLFSTLERLNKDVSEPLTVDEAVLKICQQI